MSNEPGNNPSESKRSLLEKRYSSKIIEEPELGPYLLYTGNKDIPFLHMYRFKEAFSFPLVWELLNKVKADETDYVIDPFCGSGTTLFTSFLRGIPSVGVDALPLACFISKTLPKFLFLKRGELELIWKKLLPKIEKSDPAPTALDVPIMKVAFQKNILVKLRKMKAAIDELEEFYRDIFLFLFFSLLEECSQTEKVKSYPRVIKGKKGINPIDAMKRRIKTVKKDITLVKTFDARKENIPDVFLANTLDLSAIKKNPTILITSPPYADRIDYTRVYALELCFHFVKNVEEFKKLKYNLLRSYMPSELSEGEEPPHPVIKEVVTALKEKLRKSKLPDMLTGYFLDMKKIINQWYTILGIPARAAVVSDNLWYEGVIIPVDLILSDMAEEAGFTVEKVIVANYRKKRKEAPLRESIVIWRK